MDLGSEITTRLKTSIKTKLQELGSYIDDELPEYILVMISNKRTPSQMKDDLSLFLGDETDKFVSWVFSVLGRLQEATEPAEAEEEIPEPNADSKKDTKRADKNIEGSLEKAKAEEKVQRKFSKLANEKNSGQKENISETVKTSTQSNKSSKNEDSKKSTSKKDNSRKRERKDKDDKDATKKHIGQKRSLSSDNEEDSTTGGFVASKVEVQKKTIRPSLPAFRQASGNLIKRAMEEARKSVNKPPVLVASHEYSHDNCDSVVWIQDPELREQQKQVLLRQHRELEELRTIKDQLKKQKEIIDQSLPQAPEKGSEQLNENDKNADLLADEKDGIELEVDDNEFEEWIEINGSPKDRRVIDASNILSLRDNELDVSITKDSTRQEEKTTPTSADEHSKPSTTKEETDLKDERVDKDVKREVRDVGRSGRDRHSRRRSTRHKDTEKYHDRKQPETNQENTGNGGSLLSPKFVVTLNGVDSDYEKKFEDEHRRERRKRKINDRHNSSCSDTLFINLDKRTNHLKPLEIMQQALLAIQQPLLPGQLPPLQQNFDLSNPALPPPKPPTDMFGTFDLRNHLVAGPKPVTAELPNSGPQGLNVPQSLVPQPLPSKRPNQTSTRNLTNLVPLSLTPSQNDPAPTKDVETTTPKLENSDFQTVPSVEQVRIRLDSESADEEGNEMETEAILERCKFWPECKNGVSCPYVHPTVPCKSFPNCSYADKCIFLHPVCKFDGRCSNVSCPYVHTSKQKIYGGSGAVQAGSSDLSTPLCRFYPNCSKKFCPFRHPIGKPCRYGSGCTRTGCLFAHETKPANRGALTWTAVQKDQKPHTSNRQFACSESAVVAVPVTVST